MATATVDSTTTSDRPLNLDSIPIVDLALLSQSELYALSLCSNASFDPRRCDDVVIPKIDRSVFNESAGSRKQTYSRLRLAPATSSSGPTSSSGLRRRTPHLRSPKPPLHTSLDIDPENAENYQIIGLLKELFAAETNNNELVPIRVDYSEPLPQFSNVGTMSSAATNNNELVPIRVDYSESVLQMSNAGTTLGKRKRGRPRKHENVVVPVPVVEKTETVTLAEPGGNVIRDVVVYEKVEDRDKEVLNKNGVVVDFVALAGLEDPYGAELSRRTEGLRSEDELLGFFSGLNGQWGSRRKKKRIVDASEFGDVLPKGWKLLLSLKKKEGRVWMFCRRYISPNGRQFVSCKEVSSYLLSILGHQDDYQPKFPYSDDNIQVTKTMGSENTTVPTVQEGNRKENLVCHSLTPITPRLGDNEKQVILQIGAPVQVEVGEIIIKCHKCNLTFDRKDDLLHHQLSAHRRKRCKVGTSITDGVIIKEGKFECQFCHKTFNERNRYNGHMGAHVRHHARSSDASPPVNAGVNIDPVSSIGVHQEESVMLEASFGLDTNVVAETFHANFDRQLIYDPMQSKVETGSSIETYVDWFDFENGS